MHTIRSCVSLVLVVAVLNLVLAPAAFAGGKPLTPEEDRALAEREAASPELAGFEGGSTGEVILIVAVVAIITYLIVTHNQQHGTP